MKLKVGIIAVALSGLMVYGWYSTFVHKTTYISEIENNINKGNEYVEKGYYYEAAEYYKKAEDEQENMDLEEVISYCYYMLGDDDNSVSWANKAYENGCRTEYIYEVRVQNSIKMGDKKKACDMLVEARESGIESEVLEDTYREIKSEYTDMYFCYRDVSEFNCQNAIVWEEENCYVVDGEGKKIMPGEVTGIFDVSGDDCIGDIWDGEKKIYVGKCGDQYKFYDQKGYLRLSPEGNYSYMGAPRDGMILVKKGELWGYIDTEFNEINIEYEDATCFSCGRAAVKKNGTWSIVDSSLNPVNDRTYEDVLFDEYKVCSVAGAIFVKEGNSYSMVSSDGEVLLDNIESAKCFLDKDGYAAVKCDGKWKLTDSEGEIVYEGEEEINSTNCGIFGYREAESWGYKYLDGSICIEPKFQDVKAFNQNGYAFVKENDVWSMIQMEVFE